MSHAGATEFDPYTHKVTEITRFEVIDESGRVYTNHNVESIVLSAQDDGKTLKIFIDENKPD